MGCTFNCTPYIEVADTRSTNECVLFDSRRYWGVFGRVFCWLSSKGRGDLLTKKFHCRPPLSGYVKERLNINSSFLRQLMLQGGNNANSSSSSPHESVQSPNSSKERRTRGEKRRISASGFSVLLCFLFWFVSFYFCNSHIYWLTTQSGKEESWFTVHIVVVNV